MLNVFDIITDIIIGKYIIEAAYAVKERRIEWE